MVVLALLIVGSIFAISSRNNAPKSTIPTTVVSYDSLQLNRLVVDTKDGEPYELILENGTWKLQVGEKLVAIESEGLESALVSIKSAKPKRVVSRKEENWPTYEVDEESCTKLMFYNGSEALAGVCIGKLDFNQQKRSMTTFIRQYDANDVYIVDGPITFDWNKQANDWRNKQLVSVNAGDIQKVVVSGISNFSLVKSEELGWSTQGIDLDSAGIEQYISAIANVTSSEFNDEVEVAEAGSPSLTLEIYTDTENVTVSMHSTAKGEVLQSTSNPGSMFSPGELMSKLLPAPSVAPAEGIEVVE